MLDVIFWGASGQAKVLRECIEYDEHRLVACFDNNEQTPAPFHDVPLYFQKSGFQRWRSSIYGSHYHFLVAIGGSRGYARCELHHYLTQQHLSPFTAIHPTAYVADACSIGAGSQILANASVCVDCTIGIQTIINTAATVDHECIIGNGVHICPGAHVAGLVRISDFVMVGTGAVVLPRINIGEGAQIGAGSVVLHDVAPYTVVVGNPARVIKTLNKEGDCNNGPQ